jgi:hypothetical protein
VAAEQAGLSDSAGGYGVTAITEKILSSVAWQAPPTCVSIDAFAVGGGGGGVQGGGGGGGGYTALLYSIATVPGEVLDFTV